MTIQGFHAVPYAARPGSPRNPSSRSLRFTSQAPLRGSISSPLEPPRQIRQHSLVIADTADFAQLESLPPVLEVTTNPTIIWQSAQLQDYFGILDDASRVR
jgi:hypothetical protein